MRLRLVSVIQNRNGTLVDESEQIVEGESQKPINRASAKRLIARHFPDARVSMVDSYTPPHKWCAVIEQVNKNEWRYIYATPVD